MHKISRALAGSAVLAVSMLLAPSIAAAKPKTHPHQVHKVTYVKASTKAVSKAKAHGKKAKAHGKKAKKK